MILVDTSVWIEHLRKGNAQLKSFLIDELVLSHPFVAGELACGGLRNREEILSLFAALPAARVAEHAEVLHFLKLHRLYGQGLGWIDVHLLASAMLSDCAIWTLDERLRKASDKLGISL